MTSKKPIQNISVVLYTFYIRNTDFFFLPDNHARLIHAFSIFPREFPREMIEKTVECKDDNEYCKSCIWIFQKLRSEKKTCYSRNEKYSKMPRYRNGFDFLLSVFECLGFPGFFPIFFDFLFSEFTEFFVLFDMLFEFSTMFRIFGSLSVFCLEHRNIFLQEFERLLSFNLERNI